MTIPHEADPSFKTKTTPKTEIARAVLRHPRVIRHADKTCDALVLALRDELLVRRVPGDDGVYGQLQQLLQAIAVQSGALSGEWQRGGPFPLAPGHDVEIWRLTSPYTSGGDAISQTRRLRDEIYGNNVPAVPIVSPNHVGIVCGYDMCPDGPPRLRGDQLPPQIAHVQRGRPIRVAIIDSGYVEHPALTGRVTAEPGQWFDSIALPKNPAQATKVVAENLGVTPDWRNGPPDDFNTYRDAENRPRLAGVAGHGTFIAGIVAAGCPRAEITVVGHRHECLPVGWNNSVDKLRLFASEIAIARSLLIHRDHHVISCGFAFPILDGLESIAFDVVMPSISDGTAVVAPAGNESTTCRYWPAAHDRVIGVASTDRTGVAKADFSNWGTWADCCSIGEDVLSTFADVEAFPQDSDPPAGATTPHFDGWARWDGTSFAAPKVAAKIAEMFAANSSVSPRAHASALLTTAGVTDDGVELPYVA